MVTAEMLKMFFPSFERTLTSAYVLRDTTTSKALGYWSEKDYPLAERCFKFYLTFNPNVQLFRLAEKRQHVGFYFYCKQPLSIQYGKNRFVSETSDIGEHICMVIEDKGPVPHQLSTIQDETSDTEFN